MTDYTTLFHDSDILTFGGFRITYHRQGGEVMLSDACSHPLVFVLQGSLTVKGRWQNRTVPQGSLMAVNQKKIQECRCEADTIIIEYLCSPRFVAYLDRCSDTFDESFSHLTPISPALYAWFDGEFATQWPADPSPDELCVQRKAFATIMSSYPQHLLQELYICFYACSTGDCKNCDKDAPFASAVIPKNH